MSRFFYGRVSAKGQNLARQLAVAREYKDIDENHIFCDTQSGRSFDRAEYQRLKSVIRSGDELIIKELDRLGRNKEEIKEELKWFRETGITVRILDVPTTLIDFGGQEWIRDMINNILIEVLGAISEQERKKTLARQREGIDAMQIVDGKHYSEKSGKFYGRPRKDVADVAGYYKKQQAGERTVRECCEALGISRSKWYTLVKSFQSI